MNGLVQKMWTTATFIRLSICTDWYMKDEQAELEIALILQIKDYLEDG